MLRTWQRNLVCAIAGADWCPRELHISGIGFKRSLDAVARALPVPQPEAGTGSDSDTGSGPGDWHGHASALCQRVLGALGRPDLAESYLRVLAERRAAQVDGYRPMLVEAFASAAALPGSQAASESRPAGPAASAPTSASVTTTPAGSQAAAGVLYVDYCLSQRHCTWQWSAGSGSRVRLRLHLAAFCTVTASAL